MALAGSGVLAIWNGIAEEAEDDFVAWHVEEHIPERVAVPGFLKARRYLAVSGSPKYFNFYETQTPDVLGSDAYRKRLDTPSDWTKRVVRHFRETSRTACRVVASLGQGDGGCIGTLRFDAGPTAGYSPDATVLATLLAKPGIVAVHLLQGQAAVSSGPTAEKALRDRPDEIVGWILMIEAVAPGLLDDVAAEVQVHFGPGEWGVYQLQFALAGGQPG